MSAGDLLVFVAFGVACVVVATGIAFLDMLAGQGPKPQPPLRVPAAPRPCPVIPLDEGERNDRALGVARRTEEDAEVTITATTRANAIAEADPRGIDVTHVEQVPEPQSPAARERPRTADET